MNTKQNNIKHLEFKLLGYKQIPSKIIQKIFKKSIFKVSKQTHFYDDFSVQFKSCYNDCKSFEYRCFETNEIKFIIFSCDNHEIGRTYIDINKTKDNYSFKDLILRLLFGINNSIYICSNEKYKLILKATDEYNKFFGTYMSNYNFLLNEDGSFEILKNN